MELSTDISTGIDALIRILMVDARFMELPVDRPGSPPISLCMDIGTATAALAALSQVTRLETFRLLSGSEPDGLAAGEIARRLEVPQNLMSSHLRVLSQAGLVTARRDGKSMIYRARLDAWEAVVTFMTLRSMKVAV